MSTAPRDFNKEAAMWDENPMRIKMSQDVTDTIRKQIVLEPEMNVMDFGCGTGLVTLRIQPFVNSIIGIDSSQGMLDVFNVKVAKLELKNVSSLFVNPDKGDILSGNYNLVLSNMTLHHIKEIEALLKQFHDVIAPGGYLCISDLDLDNGQFHNDNTGVFHFGFSRESVKDIFTNIGFENVKDTTAAEVTKSIADGQMKTFSIFLISGRKK